MLTVYLVGQPGAGKTTLMRTLTRHCARRPTASPLAHDRLLLKGRLVGCELGRNRLGHAGTDALGYSAAPVAAEWIAHRPYPLVLGEGDRLAVARFLDAAAAAGDLVLVWLDTPAELAAGRRVGRTQQSSWVQGRVTKVANLVEGRPHVRLDGRLMPLALVTALLDRVPELATLTRQEAAWPPPSP